MRHNISNGTINPPEYIHGLHKLQNKPQKTNGNGNQFAPYNKKYGEREIDLAVEGYSRVSTVNIFSEIAGRIAARHSRQNGGPPAAPGIDADASARDRRRRRGAGPWPRDRAKRRPTAGRDRDAR